MSVKLRGTIIPLQTQKLRRTFLKKEVNICIDLYGSGEDFGTPAILIMFAVEPFSE